MIEGMGAGQALGARGRWASERRAHTGIGRARALGERGRWASESRALARNTSRRAAERRMGALTATRPCRLRHGRPWLRHGRAKGHDTATVGD